MIPLEKISKIINTYSVGIADQTSMNLWKKRSVLPPKYPWIAPAETPIIIEKKVKVKPNKIDILNP